MFAFVEGIVTSFGAGGLLAGFIWAFLGLADAKPFRRQLVLDPDTKLRDWLRFAVYFAIVGPREGRLYGRYDKSNPHYDLIVDHVRQLRAIKKNHGSEAVKARLQLKAGLLELRSAPARHLQMLADSNMGAIERDLADLTTLRQHRLGQLERAHGNKLNDLT